jgi:hypothetical protein
MALSASDYNVGIIFLKMVLQDFQRVGVVPGTSNETTWLVNVGAVTNQSDFVVTCKVRVDGLIEESEEFFGLLLEVQVCHVNLLGLLKESGVSEDTTICY